MGDVVLRSLWSRRLHMGNPEEPHLLERPLESFPISPPFFAFPNFFIFSLFFYQIIKKQQKSYIFNVLIIFFPLSRPSPLPPQISLFLSQSYYFVE